MRLEQIQAFLTVAETGSFQKAAKQCGVTQSTVSRQIQALEEELGLLLFHRGIPARLTVGGDRILPHARKIGQEWAQAREVARHLLGGEQQELCVAAIHSACAQHLPPVLQQFCRDFPQVQLRVTALGSDRALKVLNDGLVDLAIVMNDRRFTMRSELEVAVLFEEPVSVLMAANHPLSGRDLVSVRELSPYPQAVFKDGYGMQRLVRETFEREALPVRAVLELNMPEAFRGVVRQGEWLALLPESALTDARKDRALAVLPVCLGSREAPVWLKREVVMATTKDRLQFPPVARFWELALQHVRPSWQFPIVPFELPTKVLAGL